MEKRLSCFLFLVVAFSIIQVVWSQTPSGCYCQDTSIANFDDFLDRRFEIDDFLWTIGLNNWSPLANELKGKLQVLLRQGNPDSVNFAELTILFMSTFNPYIDQQPSACALASIINSSVSCQRDGDNTAILNDLNSGLVSDFYETAINFAYYSSIQSLKCPSDAEYPPIPTGDCENDGFTYDIEAAWDVKGADIPSDVRDIVLELYNSDNYRDRYIAALATFSLLNLPNQVKAGVDPLIFFEFLYLQYGPIYPECCCEERIARLQYLRDTVSAQIQAQIETLKTDYSDPSSCPA